VFIERDVEELLASLEESKDKWRNSAPEDIITQALAKGVQTCHYGKQIVVRLCARLPYVGLVPMSWGAGFTRGE